MFNQLHRQSMGTTNFGQISAYEARLNRLHRLFKTHFNVTEPSLVLEPYLFLGNCISAQDIHRLSRLGIRYILNVAKRDVELCPYYSSDMRILTIDLRDDDRENILRAFDQAFAFIDEAKREKSRVLVHCSHGQSRSPAIVIGYLMRTYNVSLEQCLIHVIKARPCVIPNDGFLKQLILYDSFLVERRRKQQEAVLMQVVNSAIPTEIPIQHHSHVVQQSAQTTDPPILTPPSCPTVSNSETSNISSMDSTSMGLSSTSSVQSSTSSNSIKFIPIQVQSKEPNLDKIEPQYIVPIESQTNNQEVAVDETNKTVDKLAEKFAGTELSEVSSTAQPKNPSSQKFSSAPKRSKHKRVKDIKQHYPPQAPLKNVAHLDNFYINQPSFMLTRQQWDFINNYPSDYHGTNKHVKTQYITEIYDRATNRFVPTMCCY